MSFMTINGLVISVENESASWRSSAYGEIANSFTNRPKRNRKGVAEEISFSSCLMIQEVADSLIGFIEGQGDHFGFEDDAWSEEGLGPESGSTYTITSGGYVGSDRIVLTSSTLIYNPEFRETKNTVCYARTADSGTTWEHLIVRADGAKWLDGIRDDAAATGELVIDSGAVSLSDVYDYDELLLLPFNIGEQHALELFAWVDGGDPFTLRTMTLEGDLLGAGRSETVIGQSDGQKIIQGSKNAVWLNNLRTVDFTLAKVDL